MILGASATHALRALAYLAASGGEEAVQGRDLAREIGVPAHYLAKVLATLARAGILTASRGVRGGYRLARPAQDVRLIEIVEPFEGKRVRPGCLLRPDQPCREDGACSAHGAWSQVKEVWSGFLETTALADIQGGDGVPSSATAPRVGRGNPARSATAGRARRGRRGVRHRASRPGAGCAALPRQD